MIIHLPADAPLIVKAAAATLLYTHIAGAGLGLVSGTVAMLSRKGRPLHRLAGHVFFGSMIAMGLAAAVTAPFLPDRPTALMGLFVAYLTATAWLAVRRPAGPVGRPERALAAVAPLIMIGFFWIAAIGAASPRGLIDHKPYALGVIIGLVTAIAAASDLAVIVRGRLAGADRLTRHVWRMSLALTIMWGSFAGQAKAQPEIIRGAPWLFLPALACLGLLAYWTIRSRWPRRARRAQPAAGARRAEGPAPI